MTKPAPTRRLCGCPCGCRVPLFAGEERICVPCVLGIRINGTHERLGDAAWHSTGSCGICGGQGCEGHPLKPSLGEA